MRRKGRRGETWCEVICFPSELCIPICRQLASAFGCCSLSLMVQASARVLASGTYLVVRSRWLAIRIETEALATFGRAYVAVHMWLTFGSLHKSMLSSFLEALPAGWSRANAPRKPRLERWAGGRSRPTHGTTPTFFTAALKHKGQRLAHTQTYPSYLLLFPLVAWSFQRS